MAELSSRHREPGLRRGDDFEMKTPYHAYTDQKPVDLADSPLDDDNMTSWSSTDQDARDMARLGKKQEFKRNFNFLSTLGFVSIYMATWEFVLVSLSVGLANGGFAGLFWCFITTIICYGTIVASLAEMASMAPTSGGQYHWVSEFAPAEYQKVLSYASGWMSTLGWLASVASSNYVCTTQIQSIINVVRPGFVFTDWQYTLLMFAVIVVTLVFNTWGAKILPGLETASLFGHALGFLVVFIPLLVLCPKNTGREVFVEFEASAGWSLGPAYLISQVTILYCNFGSDSVVHISEEVENASVVVPKAMWWSYVGNVAAGIVMLITMLFCIGPLDDAVNSDVPYLILFNNTGVPGLSVFLNIILFLLIYLGNITALATCAREMWAFSRDKGLPFSRWLSIMNRDWDVPFNTVYATSLFAAILALIQLGSTLAFNVVVSLAVLGLLSTYAISIGCVFYKRVKGEPLPPARWSLGRWGIYINGFAFFYSIFVVIFSCFPSYLPVTYADANWAPAVWAVVSVVSVGWYVVFGRRKYTAPVEFVEGRKVVGVGVQST